MKYGGINIDARVYVEVLIFLIFAIYVLMYIDVFRLTITNIQFHVKKGNKINRKFWLL